MATHTFTLRGDQIGTYSSYSGLGNGDGRVVTVNDVQAFGLATDTYTIEVTQVMTGVSQFHNGQSITIYDSLGNVVMPTTSVHPDNEQGMAAGDEHLILTNGFMIDLKGFSSTPQTHQYGFADEAAGTHGDDDGELDFADASTFPCFRVGTRIATPDGWQLAEDLRAGDLVLTRDNGAKPVIWAAQRTVTFDAGGRGARRPVLIREGAFGPDSPARDLVLSAQHRVSVTRGAAGDVLAAATRLTPLPRIREMQGCRRIDLVTILLDSHQIISAEGLWVESFYPGPAIMSALPGPLRAAILARLPMLSLGVGRGYGPPARPIVTGAVAQRIVQSLGACLVH